MAGDAATWLCTGGTRLATTTGAVAVERLLPGTDLVAREGGVLRVTAVGRIRLSVAELAARPALWPVHVAAGALEDGVPERETTVLPDQPITLRGFAQMPASWLIDGISLRRPAPLAPLDVYSLILAGEGSPLGDACLLDASARCGRPSDDVLYAARAKLAAGAGVVPGVLAGSIDRLGVGRVEGWADDGSGHPVALELEANGIVLAPLVADLLRPDLAAAGIGDGRRGFRIVINPKLDPRRRHLVRVRRAVDGADMPGSPALVDGAAGLGALLDTLVPGEALRRAVETAARVIASRLAARR